MKKFKNIGCLFYGGLSLLLLFVDSLISSVIIVFLNSFIDNLTLINYTSYILSIVFLTISIYLVYKMCRKRNNYNLINNNKIDLKKCVLVFFVILIIIILRNIIINNIKIIHNIKYLGVIISILKYISSILTVILMYFSINLIQYFFESNLKITWLPYGGAILGIIRFIIIFIASHELKASFLAFGISIIYGIIYLIFNKNTKYSILAILMLYIL